MLMTLVFKLRSLGHYFSLGKWEVSCLGMAELYTGDLGEHFILSYLRGPERPTIYAAKRRHILAAEKRSKFNETIRKTGEDR